MARKKPEPAKKQPAAAKAAPASAGKTVAVVEQAKPAVKEAEPAVKAEKPAVKKAEPTAKAEKPAAEQAKTAEKKAEKPAVKKTEPAAKAEKAAAKKAEPAVKAEAPAAKKTEPAAKAEKPAAKKAKPAAKKTKPAAKKPAPAPVNEVPAPVEEPVHPVEEAPMEQPYVSPRRSVAFIGSECHPFVKTGGLGDVMYALPRELVKQNCDVRVILPRYACIPQQYQEKMVYRGEFYMDLGLTGRSYYVGIMEYVWDGVVYDFIDNQEFFSAGNPYISLVDDIPKYCYFSKAALAALNFLNWIPDVIHCHDWQAALVPVYLRTMFQGTPVGRAKTVLTIHNLRFQGIYNIPTLKYWTGLPNEVFEMGAMKQDYEDANMLKGGLAYADRITTVSGTYAWEIQTPEYGEHLEDHLRYHSYKLRGIVNGIDYGMWNPATDPALAVNYDITNVLDHKWQNKLALQEELGLVQDQGKFVIGLISRLTNQKGLDLVNAIVPELMDGNTQVIVLGTGDKQYEDTFRYYENAYRGMFSACIQYDESRAHRIYAGADALLVPSRFEPCGLTQLNAMHYGTLPIVRETGGLKDTVEPYNIFNGDGNGFTFDRYDAGLLLDAVNRAKTEYFVNRYHWDEVVQRDMAKDVSWQNSARQYKDLYLELTPW
ncbi:MAG TPA: glycogen/starch synthase [Candidatus Gemmiger excrementigallinarum]|uniref:Glycogen synthase n=1 Tax=Candidatus Gemmiger excrementigallinarum TaxID=2838609 RepID=A0A9D2ET33_9FIRM|nr:glycogen/starch synthase [Candidatus Gemmiger excrementigallinarum]